MLAEYHLQIYLLNSLLSILSYVLWEENGIIPILMLEVVSEIPNGEYSKKRKQYAQLGVLYYVIYAPRRRRKEPLEVYGVTSSLK